MARKKRTPEENARREKIRELCPKNQYLNAYTTLQNQLDRRN